jgi:hypothetical protein
VLATPPTRTAAQARADKKALIREREAADRRQARATLKALREAVREAKAKRKEARRAASARCRDARLAAKTRARELREAARKALVEAVRLEKQAARETCQRERQQADQTAGGAVRAAAEKAAAEARYQRELARIERRADRRREASKRERRQESDEAVERDVPPELVPLWRRVRRTIRGNARTSRLEAFLRYAEENPDDIVGAQESDAERQLAAWQREQARRTKRRRSVDDVPF